MTYIPKVVFFDTARLKLSSDQNPEDINKEEIIAQLSDKFKVHPDRIEIDPSGMSIIYT